MATPKPRGKTPRVNLHPGYEYRVRSGGCYGKPIPVVYGTARVTGYPVIVYAPRDTNPYAGTTPQGTQGEKTYQIEPTYKAISPVFLADNAQWDSTKNKYVPNQFIQAPGVEDQLATRWNTGQAEISRPGGTCKAPVEGPVASVVYVFCEGPILTWGPWFWRGTDRIWWLNITGTSGSATWPAAGDIPDAWATSNYQFRIGERDYLDFTNTDIPNHAVSNAFRLRSKYDTRAYYRFWGYGLASLCVNEISLLNGSLPEISVEMIGMLGTVQDASCIVDSNNVYEGRVIPTPYLFAGTGTSQYSQSVDPDGEFYDHLYHPNAENKVINPTMAMDAVPGEVIKGQVTDGGFYAQGILTDQEFGLAWDPTWIETDLGMDGHEHSSYDRYCQHMGFNVSQAITEQSPTSELLSNLLDCTNSTCVWSDHKLKLIPLGYAHVGGVEVGAGYDPPESAYSFTNGDYCVKDNEDFPVTITREAASDIPNVFPVAYCSRQDDFSMVEVEWQNDASVDENEGPFSTSPGFGVRKADTFNAPWIPNFGHAMQISALRAQRAAIERNHYAFRIPWRFFMLEPGDIVTISEVGLGLVDVTVRIISIEIDSEECQLSITAVDCPLDAASMQSSATARVDPNNTTLPAALSPTSMAAKLVPQTNLINRSGTSSSSSGSVTNEEIITDLSTRVMSAEFSIASLSAKLDALSVQVDLPAGTDPYDLLGYCPGTPLASQVMFSVVIDRVLMVPADWAGCHAKVGVNATASTVFSIKVDGVEVGTITFTSSGSAGTFSSLTARALQDGQVFSIVAPASPDATLADLSFSFTMTRG